MGSLASQGYWCDPVVGPAPFTYFVWHKGYFSPIPPLLWVLLSPLNHKIQFLLTHKVNTEDSYSARPSQKNNPLILQGFNALIPSWIVLQKLQKTSIGQSTNFFS